MSGSLRNLLAVKSNKRTVRLAVSLGILAVSGTHSIAGQTVSARPLVIRDANVIDVRTGAINHRTTVIVDGNRIVQLGPTLTIRLPKGAQVIEARGKYLIPGLIDTHVHLFRPWRRNWPDTLAQFGWILASGVTTVRDAAAAGLEPNYAALRAANGSGRILIPRIRISGFVQGVVGSEKLSTMSDALARFRPLGLDQVKIINLPREEALATIRAARAAGLSVYGHTWQDYVDSDLESTSYTLAAVRAGISGLSHHRYRMAKDTLLPDSGPRLAWGSPPDQVLKARLYALAGWLMVDQQGLRTLIDTMLARGTWYEPTLGVNFPSVCTKPIDLVTLRRYVPFDTDAPMAVPTPAQTDTLKRICDGMRAFVKRFYDAGVMIVTGSDTDPFPPRGVTEEMRLLAEAGIPALGVLKAATMNAARVLDMDRDIGTIEKGKLADLVLLDANPLTDITNVRRIAAVVANGRLVDRRSLLNRTGTTPVMVSLDDRLDRLQERVRALAFSHPDSVIEVLVYTDGTMRPEDLRGVAPTRSPVSILGVNGRILRLKMPAVVTRITSRIRFVVRIELADTAMQHP